MISRIVDTAHTLAVRHTEGDHPDLDAARRAALRGLEIDETAEVLYRDWMNIEWGAANTAGVRKAITRLHQIARVTTSPSNPSPNNSSTSSCPTGPPPHTEGGTDLTCTWAW
ncbi:ANTAR domain-containing protein OS=Streptomyces microflavus OX=1919 GN=Smic_78950 PE=4 SV=1 [Streptomyces microflavus]